MIKLYHITQLQFQNSNPKPPLIKLKKTLNFPPAYSRLYTFQASRCQQPKSLFLLLTDILFYSFYINKLLPQILTMTWRINSLPPSLNRSMLEWKLIKPLHFMGNVISHMLIRAKPTVLCFASFYSNSTRNKNLKFKKKNQVISINLR